MEEDSKPIWLKWGLGALGLGAIAGTAAISIWIAVAILVLAVLLFGGLWLWRRWSRRRASGDVIRDVGQGSSQGVMEAEKRAELDSLMQRFRTGLKEFDHAGYSVYDYPWFVVIGESGAGKTEAVRSALEDQVPASVRHHIPPKDKGTKDFVWWFTKHGIVLDTAGRMVVSEGEGASSKDEAWRLFLKSLRKARPRCPINGLLLALSAESLIKDSVERISEKATQLAQRIEMIQRELDVRFPVYLVVTKTDLLTGFREFTERIDDVELQHQIFGWSNPDALDSPFDPDQVESYLQGVVEQIKRRRLALLRPAEGARLGGETQFFSAGGYQLGQGSGMARQMDEVDALFAFPESLMRLAPRLKQYLRTIFVAGPFSPKPVFLRGIYFTSAMREGRALDEAMALIAGVGLDSLPEDRAWDRNKAFFLRDLFVEKVVKEKGLVTRAKNTLKVLRQRQVLIFGSAAAAMLLLLGFAYFGYRNLSRSAQAEARVWQAAARNWSNGEWTPQIIKSVGGTGHRYVYNGDEAVGGTNVVGFHRQLRRVAETNLPVSFIFKPISIWGGGPNKNRLEGQRQVLLGGVLAPLFNRTRDKMRLDELKSGDSAGLRRHQDALLELIRFEAEALAPVELSPDRAEACLRTLLSYLTETDTVPDTNLVNLVASSYAEKGSWPPTTASIQGGASLTNNLAVREGLEKMKKAGGEAQARVASEMAQLGELVAALKEHGEAELRWLADPKCEFGGLEVAQAKVWSQWKAMTNASSLTNRYQMLRASASAASASPIIAEVTNLLAAVPEALKARSLVKEVAGRLQELGKESLKPIDEWYATNQKSLASLDTDLVAGAPKAPAFETRWRLYTNACALRNAAAEATLNDVGQKWQRFSEMRARAEAFEKGIKDYKGPLEEYTVKACGSIASQVVRDLKSRYVQSYISLVSNELKANSTRQAWDINSITNARIFFSQITQDIASKSQLEAEDQSRIEEVANLLPGTQAAVLTALSNNMLVQLGFPVQLGVAGAARSIADLAKLRELVNTLKAELNNPVWGNSAAGLRTRCEFYEPMINMLVGKDGMPVEWKLSFVPPGDGGSATDANIVAIIRSLEVGAMNDLKAPDDLSRIKAKWPIGTLRADKGVKLTFRTSAEAAPSEPVVEEKSWWVAGLLREKGDVSWDEKGTAQAYRFKVLLKEYPSQPLVFEVAPKDSTVVVPPFKNWKQGVN